MTSVFRPHTEFFSKFFFRSSQFSRIEIWHTSVEVCDLCFERLEQNLVCFGRLNPSLICFDRLDPSCICFVHARPRKKNWTGGSWSYWVQSRFFVTEKCFERLTKKHFDQSSTEEFFDQEEFRQRKRTLRLSPSEMKRFDWVRFRSFITRRLVSANILNKF